MATHSIFALSSRFEGFPLILSEAMSKGMAPVTFDCPTGPAEMIRDGENGLIVPLGEIDAFAAALIRMIEDDELRRRCGAGRARDRQGIQDGRDRPDVGRAVSRAAGRVRARRATSGGDR